MKDPIAEQFLEQSVVRLEVLSGRIDDCLGRLTAGQMWHRGGEAQNAVGNLVLHLCGNLRQWIMSGIGTAADARDRDREFAASSSTTPEELRRQLKDTVAEATALLRHLPAERLLQQVHVQAFDVSVLQAIYSVVEHFAQHAGQIIFATKQLTNQDLGYYAFLSRGKRG